MSRPRFSFHAAAAAVLIPILLAGLILAIFQLVHPGALAGGGSSNHPAAREPRLFAPIVAVGAVALGWQLYITSRRGYVYCGHTETVSRSENPKLYRAWFIIHCLFVAELSVFALVLFRAWVQTRA